MIFMYLVWKGLGKMSARGAGTGDWRLLERQDPKPQLRSAHIAVSEGDSLYM